VADSVPLSWRIKERPGFTTVEFAGEIDEEADFSELRRQLRGSVVFRLQGISHINSCGVREWIHFVRDLPNVSELVLTHCSHAFVAQLNMIDNFRGAATVRSFYAPYVCESCNNEEERLLDVGTHFADGDLSQPPPFLCEKCQRPLVFDDLPERYLSFLAEA